jgi:hypothetical protein
VIRSLPTSAVGALALALGSGLWLPGPLLAAPGAPGANAIVLENREPGVDPAVWDLPEGKSDPQLQGFATAISVNRGETVSFKVQTAAASYRLDIYRLGWYGGKGARLVARLSPSAALPQAQPACSDEPVDCGNWAVSASWPVPATATTGVYVAKLVRLDGVPSGGSHIVFVVRRDRKGGGAGGDASSDILFQTSDTTWQAYNQFGGEKRSSLYNGAVRVSYNRPFTTRDYDPAGSVFGAEYNMIRWLERNGYDVAYFTGADAARRGAEILAHRVYLSVGHDEYWSGEQRANVEAARAAGVNLAFFSGNEVFWKTAWESDYRVLVCYKETAAGAQDNPSGEFTGTWRDPRFRGEADPPRPENELTGTLFGVNRTAEKPIQVPQEDGALRFWRNTGAATLPACGVLSLAPRTLGFEWDEDEDNGFRPPGLFRLSTTFTHHAPRLYGLGTAAAGSFFNEVSGMATHHLTLYRHPSGALVFGAGTIQWSWGLDATHLCGKENVTMQQATVNLLADMGAQPASPQSAVVPAAPSTDSTPPVSTITSPADGAELRYGSAVAITGTASDVGGRVAGVEVSVDGGATWRRAEGRESFRYLWMASTAGPLEIRSRAVDDSGNLESPASGVSVRVGCLGPCSLWPATAAPATPWVADRSPVELGLRFRSDADGVVSGIRFYRGRGNNGPHRVHLFAADGTLLAEGFIPHPRGGRRQGWQTVAFDSPVAITANTLYVAAYSSQSGYASDAGYFAARGRYAAPLRALPGGGVYSYGPPGVFPDQAAAGANYWIDVLFEPGQSHPRGLLHDDPPPSVAWQPDSRPVEVGVRFRTDSDGFATGIRFWKGSGNTGIHVVNLWGARSDAATPPEGGGGRLLASATALAETASGWQTVTFARPVAIIAGGEYVASYHSATGYAREPAYFAGNRVDDPPLHATGSAFRYGRSGFPNQDGMGANYWVDPVFQPTASFPSSILGEDPAPATPLRRDSGEIEVGLRFQPEVDGYVTGVRFWKHSANGGPHTASLWSSGGADLASAPFSAESACGWQVAFFAKPVKVSGGATYVASYHTTTGYAQDESFFARSPETWRGIWNPPLRALADMEPGEGQNGVYRDGPRAFPDLSFKASNYWVDVVFQTTVPEQ